jgi:RNA ligase (TIGR02306 family)
MSSFSVPVIRIRGIEPIANADAIELAVVGDYRSVVRKGQFTAGSLAVYLPEASVLPDSLIEELGLVGKLAGGARNRVKAIRLRGCLSQGILRNQSLPLKGKGFPDEA